MAAVVLRVRGRRSSSHPLFTRRENCDQFLHFLRRLTSVIRVTRGIERLGAEGNAVRRPLPAATAGASRRRQGPAWDADRPDSRKRPTFRPILGIEVTAQLDGRACSRSTSTAGSFGEPFEE